MKRFWRAAISVAVGSVAGFAFYQAGCQLLYLYRQAVHLAPNDPFFHAVCFLTLPVTASAAMAMHFLLRRAFDSR